LGENDIRERIERLREEIRRHNHLYYDLDSPEISDEKYRRTTRREKFLAEMASRVVPWKLLVSLIEPFYPKPGKGRPPIGLERMLPRTILFRVSGEYSEVMEQMKQYGEIQPTWERPKR